MPVEEGRVTYEDLAELEKDFDIVELEILRQQTKLQAPLFARRAELISRIPHFWALVLEQAPPEIDQFIQPSDSQVLASHLVSIDVQRFEIAPAAAPGADEGNPRSVLIRFQFSPNDWFEDEVLEKQFWFRHSLTGWSGLVSEPVRIRWKGGKDLTEGLTEAAFVAWEAEQRASNGSSSLSVGQKSSSKRLPEQEALCKMMETSTEGSLSFFTWFGYRGRHVTAEESAQAVAAEKKKRETYKAGDANDGQEEKATREEKPDGDEDNDDDDDDAQMAMEVFPAGEDLAIAVSEDLFPAAVKYFTQAQEVDDGRLSDADFEEAEVNDDEEDDDQDEIVDLRELVRRNNSKPGRKFNDDDEDDEDDDGKEVGQPRKRRKKGGR